VTDIYKLALSPQKTFRLIAKACSLRKTSLFVLGVVRNPYALYRHSAEFLISKVENVVTTVLKG